MRVLMLCTLAAVGACQRDSGQPGADKPPVPTRAPVVAKKGPTAAELTAGMVEAASQGKSQLPVELKFDLLQRPTVGQALEVALALVPQIPAGPTTLQITGSEGLNLATGANQLSLPAVEAGQVYRQSVTLTPTAEGVLFLGVTVSLNHDDITESRDFSIPIIVASSADGGGTPP